MFWYAAFDDLHALSMLDLSRLLSVLRWSEQNFQISNTSVFFFLLREVDYGL